MTYIHLGPVSLMFRRSFFSTKYTSLGAHLPPKSFSETEPWSVTFDEMLMCNL